MPSYCRGLSSSSGAAAALRPAFAVPSDLAARRVALVLHDQWLVGRMMPYSRARRAPRPPALSSPWRRIWSAGSRCGGSSQRRDEVAVHPPGRAGVVELELAGRAPTLPRGRPGRGPRRDSAKTVRDEPWKRSAGRGGAGNFHLAPKSRRTSVRTGERTGVSWTLTSGPLRGDVGPGGAGGLGQAVEQVGVDALRRRT
jgi:hypothetical protein